MEERENQVCKEAKALASTLCLPQSQLPAPEELQEIRAVSSVQSPNSHGSCPS